MPTPTATPTPTPTATVTATKSVPTPTVTATQPAATPTPKLQCDVTFDHANENSDRIYFRRMDDGQQFSICISNTYTAEFTYKIAGIVAPTPPPAPFKLEGVGKIPDSTRLTHQHESRYGGYIIRIRNKALADSTAVSVNGVDIVLHDVDLIVYVDQRRWALDFSGGFTAGFVTDPIFEIKRNDDPNDPNTLKVVEKEDAKDLARLGLAAFIHVRHKRFVPWLAGTFGIGMNESNRTTYYLGLSLRASDLASLTFGGTLTSVNRLPNGIGPGDSVTDANALSNLPTRIKGGFFLGASFKFLGTSEPFRKELAGQQEASKAPQPSGPGAGTAAAAGPTATITPTPRHPPSAVQDRVEPFIAATHGRVTLRISGLNAPQFGYSELSADEGGGVFDGPGHLDTWALATFGLGLTNQGPNKTKPILELSLRGNRNDPCTAKPCNTNQDIAGKANPGKKKKLHRVGLYVRFASNIKHEQDSRDFGSCGFTQEFRYVDRLPIGSAEPFEVTVEWGPDGVSIRTPGGSDSRQLKVPGSIGFDHVTFGVPGNGIGFAKAEWDAVKAGAKVELISATPVGDQPQIKTCPQ
jgi:hypothetical protein